MATDSLAWANGMEEALRRAGAERRFVLVHFGKRDCFGCEALENATYRDEAVCNFILDRLIPVRLDLAERSDWPHFRAHQVIWTPTVAWLDRRGAAHHQSPGYLPAREFLGALRIGVARCLLAWSRPGEAARLLEEVAGEKGNPLAAEATYWLGVAYYLRTRKQGDLMRGWRRLREEHGGTIWAARIPAGEGEEEGNAEDGKNR